MKRKIIEGEPELFVGEVLILGLVAQNPQGVWAYQVHAGLNVDKKDNATTYKRMHKLAGFGYLSSVIETEDMAATHSGPVRRMYQLTEQGQEKLSKETEKLQSILSVVGVGVEQLTLFPA